MAISTPLAELHDYNQQGGQEVRATQNKDIVENLLDAAVDVDVAAANVTLSVTPLDTAQKNYRVIRATGAPGAARSISFPDDVTGFRIAINATTGGQTITFKTVGGTGVAVGTAAPVLLYVDGTNIVGIGVAGGIDGSGAANQIATFSDADTIAGIALNATATRMFLMQVSNALAVWSALAAGDMPTGIDAENISSGLIGNGEFDSLEGLTGNIQTQINAIISAGITGTLVAGRVPYASGAQALTTEAGLEYDQATNVFSAPFMYATQSTAGVASPTRAINSSTSAAAEIVPANAYLADSAGNQKLAGRWRFLKSGPWTFGSAGTFDVQAILDIRVDDVNIAVLAVGADGFFGVMTTTPHSTLNVNGSFAAAYIAKTGNYTLTGLDSTVNCNATGGGFTITLPTAVGIAGRRYRIKKSDSTANVVTIATTSAQTISGLTGRKLATQYSGIEVESDGANWMLKNVVTPGFVPLTDGANIATDCSAIEPRGGKFKVTLAGNRTLDNPTNLSDGQQIVYEIIQDATGTRTLAYGSKFTFGAEITGAVVSTTLNKRDFLGCIYDATADKLYVTSFLKGY